MPAETPTKSANVVSDKPAEKAFDRFHPEMPRIPGVVGARRHSKPNFFDANSQLLVQIAGAAAAATAIALAISWWIKSPPRKAAASFSPGTAVTESVVPQLPPGTHIPAASGGPATVATIEELSKPWSSKKFTFAKPLTTETINAMVIRLPGGGLWAFSLQEPYGKCDLEFVTDISQLAVKYGYRATHPMVANPCNGTVYDPLKAGSLGGSTLARGEIVHGGGIRPPISIDVVVSGHSIVADGME